jgi:hypothetical protein
LLWLLIDLRSFAHLKTDKAIPRRFVPCARTERLFENLSRRRWADARRIDGCRRGRRPPSLPDPSTPSSVVNFTKLACRIDVKPRAIPYARPAGRRYINGIVWSFAIVATQPPPPSRTIYESPVWGCQGQRVALHVEPALIRPREPEFRAARSRRSSDRFAVDMEKAKSEIHR